MSVTSSLIQTYLKKVSLSLNKDVCLIIPSNIAYGFKVISDASIIEYSDVINHPEDIKIIDDVLKID